MRVRHGCRGPACLAILALLGCAPGAHALTRAKADAAAVRALKPDSATVVYGLPRALSPRQAAWGLKSVGPKKTGRQVLRPLGRKAWLFWADLHYGQKFTHPSTMLLIDDRSGRVLKRQTLEWWPVVDGAFPAFVRDPTNPRYWVVGPVAPPASSRTGPRADPPAPPPIAFAAGSLNGVCILSIGQFGDQRTKSDFERLHAFGDRLKAAGTGLQEYRVGGPTDPAGKNEQAPGGGDLANDVSFIVRKKGCTDVMLYIDGHGAATGPALVNVGWRLKTKKVMKHGKEVDKIAEYSAVNVTADDVASILKAWPNVDFKVKVDACYAGRWLLDLPTTDFANLRILEASSNAEETSSFSDPYTIKRDGTRVNSTTNNPGNNIIEVDDPAHPGEKKRVYDSAHGLSEFSNGNFNALETFATTPALIAGARSKGGDLWARAMEYASQHSTEQDFAAQQGETHPVTEVNIPSTGPAGGGGGAMTPFTVAVSMTWVHIGPGRSQVCVTVTTNPPRSGSVHITVTGPGVVSGNDVSPTLDSSGGAFQRVEINDYGKYDAHVDATASDGATASGDGTVTVTSDQGTCSPPT